MLKLLIASILIGILQSEIQFIHPYMSVEGYGESNSNQISENSCCFPDYEVSYCGPDYGPDCPFLDYRGCSVNIENNDCGPAASYPLWSFNLLSELPEDINIIRVTFEANLTNISEDYTLMSSKWGGWPSAGMLYDFWNPQANNYEESEYLHFFETINLEGSLKISQNIPLDWLQNTIDFSGQMNFSISSTSDLRIINTGTYRPRLVVEYELGCTELNEIECNSTNTCEWLGNVEYMPCSSLSVGSWGDGECDSPEYDPCYSDCTNWGTYYSAFCYGTMYCTGGSYESGGGCVESDDSIEELECSELIESECFYDDSCSWVEDIEYGNCSNYNNSSSCDANPNCFWDLCYGGWYGSWSHCCRGGSFQINNGYCEEILYNFGDTNGDGALNIVDIVLSVDFILNSQYDLYSDFNQDGVLNIIDIIEIVNILIGN